jgi:catechol 2,3-dioxygenase-like lactoylglutathione lyase family enzyme
MVTGIEHAAIASPDPEALAKWYVETLDFTINYFSEKSKTTFIKAANGAMIEIIKSNAKPRGEQDLRDAGLRHLALSVSDFAAVCDRLKAKGVKFLSEPEVKGGNSVVFFTDPEGNILHLLQREKPLP